MATYNVRPTLVGDDITAVRFKARIDEIDTSKTELWIVFVATNTQKVAVLPDYFQKVMIRSEWTEFSPAATGPDYDLGNKAWPPSAAGPEHYTGSIWLSQDDPARFGNTVPYAALEGHVGRTQVAPKSELWPMGQFGIDRIEPNQAGWPDQSEMIYQGAIAGKDLTITLQAASTPTRVIGSPTSGYGSRTTWTLHESGAVVSSTDNTLTVDQTMSVDEHVGRFVGDTGATEEWREVLSNTADTFTIVAGNNWTSNPTGADTFEVRTRDESDDLPADTYRVWERIVEFDGNTYTSETLLADGFADIVNKAFAISINLEFFDSITGHARVYVWDTEVKRGAADWEAVEDFDVEATGDTAGWGCRLVSYQGKYALEFSNDKVLQADLLALPVSTYEEDSGSLTKPSDPTRTVQQTAMDSLKTGIPGIKFRVDTARPGRIAFQDTRPGVKRNAAWDAILSAAGKTKHAWHSELPATIVAAIS